MSKNGYRQTDHSPYVSYADALEWQIDFSRAYHCTVEWKLTVRREKDGSLGLFITAFAKARSAAGGGLLGQQVVRFGRDQEAATLPAAMVRALILMDRDLGGSLDEDVEDQSTGDPAVPLP